MLHCLVRISRRVGCSHSSTNDRSAKRHRPPARADKSSPNTARSQQSMPELTEAARPRGACAARAKIRNSPRSPPVCQTVGYKVSPKRATYPTALLSREQPSLASSPQECRGDGVVSEPRRRGCHDPVYPPSSSEPETEPIQPHSFPS